MQVVFGQEGVEVNEGCRQDGDLWIRNMSLVEIEDEQPMGKLGNVETIGVIGTRSQ